MAGATMAGVRMPQKRKEAPLQVTRETATLNFKVTTEFKKEFKGYAVSQGLTMLDLLKDGFQLSKRKRSQQ